MSAKICNPPTKEPQQLYMLELLVDRVNLSPEKVQQIGSDPLSVRLNFLDFPTFHVSENEFSSVRDETSKLTDLSSERKKNNGSLDLIAGKSCLFLKRPQELVEAMRSNPLRIGVYKVVPKIICQPEKPETPICESSIPFSGCLCDQIAMATNDSPHLPEPYDLLNEWNLIDDRGNPSGTILLHLRLACLGKSFVTEFSMREKSFVFKNNDGTNEFECTGISDVNDEAEITAEKMENGICDAEGRKSIVESNRSPKPRSVIGLAGICRELTKRDGGPLEIVPSLKLALQRPPIDEISSKIRTNDFTIFQRPFSVRKSDLDFSERSIDEFPCGSVICAGGMCAGPRKIDPLPEVRVEATNYNISAVNNRCTDRKDGSDWTGNYFRDPRMRGGGRWNENLHTDRNCRSNAFDTVNEKIPERSVEALINGSCESPNRNDVSKPGCGCYGKTGTGLMGTKTSTKNGSCGNKPCSGVDCLIRVFNETQEFVNSIGKVPGLAGLGLMDPAESPFFGRDRDPEGATSCAVKNALTTNSTGKRASCDRTALPKSHRTSELKPIDTILPAPGTLHVSLGHRDPTAFHADTLSLSSLKSRRKIDENREKRKDPTESSINPIGPSIETGPCGAPRCQSRKKKLPDETSNDVSSENFSPIGKKSPIPDKSLNSRKTRLRGKSKSYGNLGPAGYRLSTGTDNCVRVSRRIMRLVNAMRDPRFCHGHRNCLDVRLRVPGNMGWLWNTGEIPGSLKPSIGWKPGAISKFVWERLQEAKLPIAGSTTSDSKPVTPNRGKRGKGLRSAKSFNSTSRSPWGRNKPREDDGEIELPPTLHIHRKDGTYYVTMYPIKAEHVNDPEMQEKTEPLQFMITKNREAEECSSSSASDMEIEFSPPAAINRYRRKEPVEDRDTQVNQQEISDAFKGSGEKEKSGKKPKKGKNKK